MRGTSPVESRVQSDAIAHFGVEAWRAIAAATSKRRRGFVLMGWHT